MRGLRGSERRRRRRCGWPEAPRRDGPKMPGLAPGLKAYTDGGNRFDPI
ncbi:hypothetical protein [Azospirillum doebereinerae]